MKIALYDTTLRDGTQREGISLSPADKLRVAGELDALGVDFIELGWPGSNPKDAEVFERARERVFARAVVTAFGSTRRARTAAGDDPQVAALIASRAPVCTIFGKSSALHVREVLRVDRDENLAMIEETVAYLVANGRRVIYDAEHFFDGAREDRVYALATLEAAARGGAEALVLCDTNGGTMPWDIEALVRDVCARFAVAIGIHAHDDSGCAVASSLAAVRAGATHVQGTINGYGERCGNANLCAIIPALALKMDAATTRDFPALAELTAVAQRVAEIANLAPDAHAPYVGKSAFAHKGGVHVAAIRRSARAYEHIDPTLVGNRSRVIVSELAGRANVAAKAEEHAILLDDGADREIVRGLKEREARGFSFEAAEASLALLMRRRERGYVPPFELVEYKVLVGQRAHEEATAEASIKIRVRGEVVHTAAEGNGPVHALDAALRKALSPAHPEVAAIKLDDYKVRILDGRDGTSATVRVLVAQSAGGQSFATVGAGTNVLEASWIALADGIEFGLHVLENARAAE